MNKDGTLADILEPVSAVNDARDAQKALKKSLTALVRAAGMDAGWARIQIKQGDVKVSADTGEGLPSFCFNGLKAPECLCARQIAAGKTGAAKKPAGAFCRERSYAFAAFAPVMDGKKTVGFIFLAAKKKSSFNPVALDALARHAGLMVHRAAQAALREKRLQTLQTVTRVGAIIASQLTLKELTQAVVEHLGRVLRTDRVNMVLYNRKEETLEFVATYFSGENNTDGTEVYPLSDGMNSWIVKNRRPLVIGNGTEEECARMGIRHGGTPAKSWMGAPMLHNGQIIGVLSVQAYGEPEVYDASAVELMSLVAAQVAVAVVNAQLYEATDRREKEKQKLYYSLTHDLLSFVTPVAGYGEVLQRIPADDLAGRKDDIGKSIADSARKITRFVEDILFYSKLEAGRLSMQPHPVNIYYIIDQSVSNFYSEMNQRKLELYVEGEKYVKGSAFPQKVVHCDTLQIERVINNCIQNALKHAVSRVEVNTRMDQGELWCTIADDGEGMPRELAPKVFDEYYQAHAGKKGVGLGLPSVKRIVEQHGGRVWVETDSGKGFAFTFSLPVTQSR
ncbi:MAG: GAF domain-containing protein [Nitrospinae bacterium]|nr:GAF domain-containing protein [Nitrospinota bacterium]